ncbi:MAG: CDP-alcohol phosphatidyltransferase family protein [Acidobacteria bacterium]|nr:CDP-alcohol phosphatidyltransferase family protein [Acidobacteriota bacterium]
MHHIPNLLCLLRIALAPWAAWLITRHDYRQAFYVFAVAAWSDFFDGLLARRMHWDSPVGAYLDPLADKFLMAVVYIALGISQAIPWWLVGLVFGRDLIILAGVGLLYKRVEQKKFSPSMAGKISTALQLLAVVLVLLVDAGYIWEPVRMMAVYAAAVGTVVSGLDYVRRGWLMMKGI